MKVKQCVEEIEPRELETIEIEPRELEAMGLPAGTVLIKLGNKQVRK